MGGTRQKTFVPFAHLFFLFSIRFQGLLEDEPRYILSRATSEFRLKSQRKQDEHQFFESNQRVLDLCRISECADSGRKHQVFCLGSYHDFLVQQNLPHTAVCVRMALSPGYSWSLDCCLSRRVAFGSPTRSPTQLGRPYVPFWPRRCYDSRPKLRHNNSRFSRPARHVEHYLQQHDYWRSRLELGP